MKNVLVIVVLIVVVAGVVGVVAYSAGQSYGETQAQNIRSEFFQSRSGTAGQSGQGGTAAQGSNVRNQAGRSVAAGSIMSIQGSTIQLTQQDGTSVTVNLSGQTVIQKVTVGSASDLQMGQHVSVQGTETNGQVAATMIQITASGQ